MNNLKKMLSALTILALSGSTVVTIVACSKQLPSDTIINLTTLRFGTVNANAKNPAAVDTAEAAAAQTEIKNAIQAVLDSAIKGSEINTDYSVDLSKVTTGDLSAGLTITITANSSSKILVGTGSIGLTIKAA